MRWPHLLATLLLAPMFSLISAWAQMPALAPLPGTGSFSGPDKFTFVVAGDNRPAKKSCPQPATPGKIFSAIKSMSPAPAFVLWTGDTISGKQPDKPKKIHEQYQEFLALAATAGVPIFNAPGNHEMDDATDTPSSAMKALYEQDMGQSYGAFNYGNSRFIALNSENQPEGATPNAAASKPKAPGAITKKQLSLLDADLAANKDKAHIFVFMHHPVAAYKPADGLDPANATALKALFAKYKNVSYVISGHEHMYYNPQSGDKFGPPPSRQDPSSDPPYYLVTGGGGAPLKSGMNGTPGSFYHYIIFNVDGATIAPSLVKVEADACDSANDPCCAPDAASGPQ